MTKMKFGKRDNKLVMGTQDGIGKIFLFTPLMIRKCMIAVLICSKSFMTYDNFFNGLNPVRIWQNLCDQHFQILDLPEYNESLFLLLVTCVIILI